MDIFAGVTLKFGSITYVQIIDCQVKWISVIFFWFSCWLKKNKVPLNLGNYSKPCLPCIKYRHDLQIDNFNVWSFYVLLWREMVSFEQNIPLKMGLGEQRTYKEYLKKNFHFDRKKKSSSKLHFWEVWYHDNHRRFWMLSIKFWVVLSWLVQYLFKSPPVLVLFSEIVTKGKKTCYRTLNRANCNSSKQNIYFMLPSAETKRSYTYNKVLYLV